LAQASDGLLYVVKFSNNLQGANLSFNESAGSELYRACGLAGPSWKPLQVTDAFIDQNPDCWMQTAEGRLRPDSGLCFGSRFLGRENIRLLEILPKSYFKRIRNYQSFWLAWLIDICAEHIDNRQAVFIEDSAGWLNAFFVDHGHLFGGPKGNVQRGFQASRYLDPRIYQSVSSRQLFYFQEIAASLDADKLWLQVQELPDEWKTRSALSGFTRGLNRLSNVKLIQNIVDTMVDAQRQANESENGKRQVERKISGPILHIGVQTTGSRHGFDTRDNNCHACV
jgi:hypothetical protein